MKRGTISDKNALTPTHYWLQVTFGELADSQCVD